MYNFNFSQHLVYVIFCFRHDLVQPICKILVVFKNFEQMSLVVPSFLKFYFASLNFIHHSDNFYLLKTMFKLSILIQFLILQAFEIGLPIAVIILDVRSFFGPMLYQSIRLFYCSLDKGQMRIWKDFYFFKI